MCVCINIYRKMSQCLYVQKASHSRPEFCSFPFSHYTQAFCKILLPASNAYMHATNIIRTQPNPCCMYGCRAESSFGNETLRPSYCL